MTAVNGDTSSTRGPVNGTANLTCPVPTGLSSLTDSGTLVVVVVVVVVVVYELLLVCGRHESVQLIPELYSECADRRHSGV